MRMRLTAALAAAALIAAGCGGDDESGTSNGPIKIGTSLPLTGADAQTGADVKQGYETWAKAVNDKGGLLGRKVELKIMDDASNQNTVMSDYNALISRDKVDFVVGTFSTRLTIPALTIAQRHRKLYLDPAGAAPEIFERKSPLYFYTEPAAPSDWGVPFAEYIAALPPEERPESVAYVITQDPFTSSTVGGMRKTLEAAGIETVVDATYPLNTQNFDSIASRVKESGAELVVNAGGFAEETGFARALMKAGAAPRYLYQTVSPGLTKEFPETIGMENTQGVFHSTRYTPDLKSTGNPEFVAAFTDLNDAPPTGGAAYAYTVGQVLEAALKAVGEEGIGNQQLLADWLHENAVDTVIGTMSWNEAGVPDGDFATGQWQDGKDTVILPPDVATTDKILHCWRDC